MSMHGILVFFPLIVRLAIPIALTAVGATFSERSGVINIGLEGMMLVGAFSAVAGTHLLGNPWLGILMAIISGILIGVLFSVLSIKYRANQVVCGVGINILALGLTTVMIKVIWGKEGISGQIPPLPDFTVPLLDRLPLVGGLFQEQSIYFFILIGVTVFSWILMYRTKIGLRLRAIGDYPLAAATAGIPIQRYRYGFVLLSSVLASLGGSYLSLEQTHVFVNDMVAGRGFMALAANIFGGWNPIGSVLASLIFAFAQAVRFNMNNFGIPNQFIQMVPYIFTLLVLVVFRRKSRAPAALGEV